MEKISQNKKIKVCFVQSHVYPFFDKTVKTTIGGAELQMYLLGTNIALDNEFEVSYLVGDFGQPKIIKHGSVVLYGGILT
ncbi:MAG: hypothetical protein ACD_46C00309G0001, partial [uncultured bacterium]